MRQTDWRLAFTGFALLVVAGGGFSFMSVASATATDPAEVMMVTQLLAGAAAATGLVLAIMGLVGPRAR